MPVSLAVNQSIRCTTVYPVVPYTASNSRIQDTSISLRWHHNAFSLSPSGPLPVPVPCPLSWASRSPPPRAEVAPATRQLCSVLQPRRRLDPETFMHVHAWPFLAPLTPLADSRLCARHAIKHGWSRQKLVVFSNESSRLAHAVPLLLRKNNNMPSIAYCGRRLQCPTCTRRRLGAPSTSDGYRVHCTHSSAVA